MSPIMALFYNNFYKFYFYLLPFIGSLSEYYFSNRICLILDFFGYILILYFIMLYDWRVEYDQRSRIFQLYGF